MLNKIELIGRLTRDPEQRGNNPEKPIAHLRLAVDRDYKRDGEPTADFFDVSAFGKQADTLLQYTRKGHLICAVGAMQFREWNDPQTGEKRYGSEVKLSEFHFLEKKEKNAGSEAAPQSAGRPVPVPSAPVTAGGYAAAPQPMPPQGAPALQPMPVGIATAPQPMPVGVTMAPQPIAGTPVHYGEPDFSGVPESYDFGPGGTALQNPPF